MFFSDNLADVHIINKMFSLDSVVMSSVWRLVLDCLEYTILFRAEHIPGKQNILPDLLSRLQVEKFSELAPHIDRYIVPNHYTSQVPAYLTETASKMLDAAVSKSTQISYRTALSVYKKIFYKNISFLFRLPFISNAHFIFCGLVTWPKEIT